MVNEMKYNLLALCFSFSFLLLVVIQPAFATSNACPCIVFRLDDVQSSYLSNVQTKILNEFQKKNASLTIGVVDYNFTSDKKLVSYLKGDLNGHSHIEIANQGWKNENFADLTESQQIKLLNNTNQNLLKVFNKKPTVFIPPYGLFNNHTLDALKQLKMKTISPEISKNMNNYVPAKGSIVLNKDSHGLYNIPSMTYFQIDNGNETGGKQIPKDKVIDSINFHIEKMGYDVLLLHPQNFAKLQNKTYVDTVNNVEINELANLIDYAKSKHIRITTLSDIVGFGLQKTPIKLTDATVIVDTNPKSSLNVASNNDPVNTLKIGNAQSTINGPTGTVQVNLKYPNGDRVEFQGISIAVYQDSNQVPYLEVESISANPFEITSLPLNHQYKIEAYDEGMLSSIDYVNLETSQQKIDMGVSEEGSIRVTALYNDQTPISSATVIIKSQDNKTREMGVTDPDGQTMRFWMASTNVNTDYYNIEVKIDGRLSYYYGPITLLSRNSDEIKIVTPWPPIVDSLITVKSYNQSNLLTSSNGDYVVDLFDYKENKISESKINNRGEAYFWNLKVGDYMFKVINNANRTELGNLAVAVDGSKTNFNIMLD